MPAGEWEFDVFTASYGEVQAGVRRPLRSRVVLSREEFPVFETAYEVAANLAVAVHGGMATQVLVRH